MTVSRLLLLALAGAAAVHQSGHIACPCDTPGAFLQMPDDEQLIEADNTVVDVNSTGNVDEAGTVDLTQNQEVDLEHDSLCVCKRVKKPTNPVRCTKPGLLHPDCNERDKFREKGFEIAPAANLTSIYPDEAIRPASGKMFHDQAVEASSVKNLAVEDKTVKAKATHVQKAGKLVLLSEKDVQPVDEQPPALEPAVEPVEEQRQEVPVVEPVKEEPVVQEAPKKVRPSRKHHTIEKKVEPAPVEVKEPEKPVYVTPNDANENAGDVEYVEPVADVAQSMPAQPKAEPVKEVPVVEEVHDNASPVAEQGGPGMDAKPAETTTDTESQAVENLVPAAPVDQPAAAPVANKPSDDDVTMQKLQIVQLKAQLAKLESQMEQWTK